jgi:hypothetical protein
MKFKPGDKVKIVGRLYGIAIGSTGIVKDYSSDGYWVRIIWCKDELYTGQQDDGFREEHFELVERHDIISTKQSNSCPRCNGELIKKIAQEPFTGKEYTIDKCKDCGWC